MIENPTFTSPAYPVIYTVSVTPPVPEPRGEDASPAHLSLALLVGGIPSFLATLPVDPALLASVTASLDEGDVLVSVEGISVREADVDGPPGDAAGPGTEPGGAMEPDEPEEPWRGSVPGPEAAGFEATDPGATGSALLPGAHLGLVCADGRLLGVARIVSRDRRATPTEVARYVLDKITSGVQVPDLASAG
jgi:hypothetical protein